MAGRESLGMSCSPEDSGTYMDFIQQLHSASAPPHGSPPDAAASKALESNLRRTHSWAPDDAVSHCSNCHRTFGMFWRKHHCRACGRIFCAECTSQRAQLPRDLDTFPTSPEGREWLAYLASWRHQSKKAGSQRERTCDACKLKVEALWRLSASIRIVSHLRLDLKDLCSWASLSREWSEAVRAVRGMHRGLQYRLPWYRPSASEHDYLLRNMRYFAGHSRWLVLMLKALDWNNEQLAATACRLLSEERQVSCQLAQCKASECHAQLQLSEAVELLSAAIPNAYVHRWVVNIIQQASDNAFECLVPLLVFELRQEKSGCACLLEALLARSKASLAIRSTVYWNLVVLRRHSSAYRRAYEQFMLLLDRDLGESVVWDELIRGRKIVKILEEMPDASTVEPAVLKAYFREAFSNLSTNAQQHETSGDEELIAEFETESAPVRRKELVEIVPTVLPCAAGKTAVAVDLAQLRVKQSATSPVVISFCCKETGPFELLYKRECLLKDQIALCVIRLMDEILKREAQLDLHIVTYRVLPTQDAAGLVEMIPNSETIHSILHHKNFTLQNWILEHARGSTVELVRDNFVKSTAAYCVISYLLAVGDRHLDNIMVTECGYLFHIDYSFFMGFDPKPMAPYMRITQDIVDALGGTDSRDYLQFKEYCSRAYNCLRNHTNLFACLLRLITEEGLALDDGCFTRARLEEELLHRFVPGESHVEAELQLLNRLEDSYRSSTPQFCIDFWHYHSRETKLSRVLSKVPSWGFTSLWPFSK